MNKTTLIPAKMIAFSIGADIPAQELKAVNLKLLKLKAQLKLMITFGLFLKTYMVMQ